MEEGQRCTSGIALGKVSSYFILDVEFFLVELRLGSDFHFEPIWEGRMKIGMLPDMTEESQEAPL